MLGVADERQSSLGQSGCDGQAKLMCADKGTYNSRSVIYHQGGFLVEGQQI